MAGITRYRLIDGRYRVVGKVDQQNGRKGRNQNGRWTCSECGRWIHVMVPFGSSKLSYSAHNRPSGGGPGTGGRCPMSMQPIARR